MRHEAVGTLCRAAVNVCDVQEVCTGSADTCPANAFASAATVCLAKGSEPCDADDTCSGTAATCVVNYVASGTLCRAAGAGTMEVQCDVIENCTGAANACPADGFIANGTGCTDSDTCTDPDTCTAGHCAGVPASGSFITATAPTATVYGGKSSNITWNYGGCETTHSYGYGVDNVRITASIDGGSSYPIMINNAAPDGGTYAWTAPPINETTVRIKVEAMQGAVAVGNDATDANFSVLMPTNVLITPLGDGDVTIYWDGGNADVYIIEGRYTDDPNAWTKFATNVASGWTDLTASDAGDTYYRLTNTGGSAFVHKLMGETSQSLGYGYTLISLPFEFAGITAQAFLDIINTPTDKASAIMRWDNGAQVWDIHYDAYGTYNDFAMELGRGYFLKVDSPTTWREAGEVVQEYFTTRVAYDYTLLGLPTGEWPYAQNLLTDMTTQGGLGHSIYKWVAGSSSWVIHYNQYPNYENFGIEDYEGYFVRNDAASRDFLYNPMQYTVTGVTATGFTVAWSTTKPSTGYIRYGTNPAALNTIAVENWATLFDADTDHTLTVGGLTTGTTYYFDIIVSGERYDRRAAHYSVTTN